VFSKKWREARSRRTGGRIFLDAAAGPEEAIHDVVILARRRRVA
jgi:hypothetical protein